MWTLGEHSSSQDVMSDLSLCSLSLCPKESGDTHYTGCVNACGITCVNHMCPMGSQVCPQLLPSISLMLSSTWIPASVNETPAKENNHSAQNPHSYTDETEYNKEGLD